MYLNGFDLVESEELIMESLYSRFAPQQLRPWLWKPLCSVDDGKSQYE